MYQIWGSPVDKLDRVLLRFTYKFVATQESQVVIPGFGFVIF